MNDDQKKPSFFGLGVVVGTIVGGLAAFFLSPRSGPENREMVAKKIKQLKKSLEDADIPKKVKEIFGEVTEEGTKLYTMVRKDLVEKITEFEGTMQDLNWEKYKQIVEEVVDHVKEETNTTAERAIKLKDFMMAEWEKAKEVEPVKKTVKMAKKTVKKAAKK